jgi:hypothetical protein
MPFDINRELERMLNPPSQVPVVPRLLRFLRRGTRLGAPRVVPTEQLQSKRATRGLGFLGGNAPRKSYPFLGKIR